MFSAIASSVNRGASRCARSIADTRSEIADQQDHAWQVRRTVAFVKHDGVTQV